MPKLSDGQPPTGKRGKDRLISRSYPLFTLYTGILTIYLPTESHVSPVLLTALMTMSATFSTVCGCIKMDWMDGYHVG